MAVDTSAVSRADEARRDETLGAGGLESAAETPVREARFPTLDGYRAIAALAVVVVHVGFETGRGLNGHGHWIAARGDLGVPIFYVLSGFLLYRPMVRARLASEPLPSVTRFLARRVVRIVPAFWVSVVAVMLVLTANAPARHEAAQWLTFLGFAQVYRARQLTVVGLAQDWSLCVEMLFYLLLPLWAGLMVRLARRGPAGSPRADWWGAAVLVLVGPAFLCVTAIPAVGLPADSVNWLPGYTGWFAGGMVLATMSVLPEDGPNARPRWVSDLAASPATCLLLAGALFAVIATPLGGPYDLTQTPPAEYVVRTLLYGGFATALLIPGTLGDQRRGLWRRSLASLPMRHLGEASYGIFLWHMLFLYLFLQITGRTFPIGHFWFTLGAVLAPTLVLAFASLYLVERPAQRLSDRWWRRRDPRLATQG